MSGIATYTREIADLFEGTNTKLLDTRKTTPNMRIFEKYAVTVGGGYNHRYNLSDGILLKDNHIGAAGSVKKAVEMAKEYAPFVRKIEVEVENLDMLKEALEAGADIIMLPFFKTAEEVKTFVELVDGRARTMPLIETREAAECIDEILEIDGIDELYIGLNDLHLSYGLTFMFQLLADGTVDRLTSKIKAKGIPYGFGGIARIGDGMLPAENILTEHYRLGSTSVILSRSFCNTAKITDIDEIRAIFSENVKNLRDYEEVIKKKSPAEMEENVDFVKEKTAQVVEIIKSKQNN